MKYSLCNNWEFTEIWSDAFCTGAPVPCQAVRLPHTCRELPLHYADPADYEMVCGYRRTLTLPDAPRLFLRFDGAAHQAAVYLNGQLVGEHLGGYTAFALEITNFVHRDAENLLAVRLDTREDTALPPFGFVIDYLTYGGLYREVWLETTAATCVTDLFVHTPTLTEAAVSVTTDAPEKAAVLRVSLCAPDGAALVGQQLPAAAKAECTLTLPDAQPWGTDHPNLYTCRAELLDAAGQVLDCRETTFGFRTAEFKADGFYLNGKKTFLRGLNRHQSYPYIGYAAPESLQRNDARILKNELHCNAVRTSHYPQSQHFLDECDKLGLLVFTELPGWQHIGDAAWKDRACEMLREMIMQNRSHPSIILWGVRINESVDDDEFYNRTNKIAHELDPSRATSGVRYLEKSHLLEDVYAYNDFSHTGDNPGCKPRRAVMQSRKKALLISEHTAHMYPTKSYDSSSHRQAQALRHARVQSDAADDGGHVGCFGWCMFDYPTHKDFGSGDRVCYHGVMDAFRNPKPAAALYASQGEGATVLTACTPMDIGDYPGGQIGDSAVLTNVDSVRLYKNGNYVTTLRTGDYPGLPHPPMILDDIIGELLETQEGFDEKKADLLRACLLAVRKHGLAHLPPADLARMGVAMTRYGLTFSDAQKLYGKYVGNWGGESTVWRLDALKGGKVASSVTLCPSAKLHLEVTPSHTELTEGDTYDMAAVRVRILDEYGSPSPYAQLPVTFRLEGAAQLVGPEVTAAEGGMTGTYVKTTGETGTAVLTVSTSQTEAVRIAFTVGRKPER